MELTAERLRELLDYDPETGIFTRITSARRPDRAGRIAGGVNKIGYWRISIDGAVFLGHRLAWLYMTGEWPRNQIDHIDGDRANNRIANLRDVTGAGNLQNLRTAHRRNKSGLLGVSAYRKNRWCMTIMHHGILVRKNGFLTPEAAHQAYLEAKRELHDTCTI